MERDESNGVYTGGSRESSRISLYRRRWRLFAALVQEKAATGSRKSRFSCPLSPTFVRPSVNRFHPFVSPTMKSNGADPAVTIAPHDQ